MGAARSEQVEAAVGASAGAHAPDQEVRIRRSRRSGGPRPISGSTSNNSVVPSGRTRWIAATPQSPSQLAVPPHLPSGQASAEPKSPTKTGSAGRGGEGGWPASRWPAPARGVRRRGTPGSRAPRRGCTGQGMSPHPTTGWDDQATPGASSCRTNRPSPSTTCRLAPSATITSAPSGRYSQVAARRHCESVGAGWVRRTECVDPSSPRTSIRSVAPSLVRTATSAPLGRVNDGLRLGAVVFGDHGPAGASLEVQQADLPHGRKGEMEPNQHGSAVRAPVVEIAGGLPHPRPTAR